MIIDWRIFVLCWGDFDCKTRLLNIPLLLRELKLETNEVGLPAFLEYLPPFYQSTNIFTHQAKEKILPQLYTASIRIDEKHVEPGKPSSLLWKCAKKIMKICVSSRYTYNKNSGILSIYQNRTALSG
jgi:hypothetical protein